MHRGDARNGRGGRFRAVVGVGVLMLAVGILIGTVIGVGGPADDADPAEAWEPVSAPEQAIHAYNTAWEEQDPDALLAVVTDDFVEEYHWYTQTANGVVVGGDDWGPSSAASYARSSDYRIDLSGNAIVVGDGRWFVTIAELQSGGGYEYDGTTEYVVVDDDGRLKLVRKS